MKQSFMLKTMLFVFIIFVLFSSVAHALKIIKVDNFLFLYDASSSMNEGYDYGEAQKAKLSFEAMRAINKDIPQHGFQAGIYTIVPDFTSHQNMTLYNKESFESSISGLPYPDKFIGQQTPLAEGLASLEPILDGLSGKTALILFSDGGENKAGNTEKMLKQIYSNYDACLHFVSYAIHDEETKIIDNLKGISNCTEIISGASVQNSYDRKEFVRKIFYATKRVTLDVKFDFDKTAIKPQFHNELKEIASFLQQYSEVSITLEGHTDSIGTREYNLDLSERRAASVKEYIVQKFGISPDRIETQGYGEAEPIADNDTASGRQKNRRVEGIFPDEFQKQ